ncbi:TetR/AcrR family transcriptional regulator [Oceanicaulis sp. MMSF_3324]|uniref:TetR/AcrR family transcriptional regulator n=1 Tax=Oceanicaulis sp. MMSF_3324 TaxID=3046702 RepID=UPI00273E3820|nr:TetR/AcrR family transcriptional regulator [Oceanicaulis sp. MMSF_3324]
MSELKHGKRFGRTDWLDLGLRQLTRHGAAGLTVEALCQAADRTRGSLYHHFTDHSAFIDAMMRHWRKRYTEDIAAQSAAQPPAEQRQALTDLAVAIDPELEIAIRRFAPSHPNASDIVASVDRMRLDFVIELYRSSGLEDAIARQIGKIEYAAYIGAMTLWPEMTAAERKALDQRFNEVLEQAGLIRTETHEDPL